jgi:hypothetical protein
MKVPYTQSTACAADRRRTDESSKLAELAFLALAQGSLTALQQLNQVHAEARDDGIGNLPGRQAGHRFLEPEARRGLGSRR